MSNNNFRSVLAPYLDGFIRMRESLGYKENGTKYVLKELDETCFRMKLEEAILTRDIVCEWRKDRLNDSESGLYKKWSVIHRFAIYMCNRGTPSYVPRMPRHKASDFMPRIFSEEEISHIFIAADNLTVKCYTPRGCLFSIPTILRVLYATGMRISEVLNLDNDDVDLVKGQILVRETKNKRQRIIPVIPSLRDVLEQYILHRNEMCLKRTFKSTNSFFISHGGKRIPRPAVESWFKKVLHLCGIPYLGGHKGPRLHDLRHSMAVHSLMKMVRQGMDTYCALPILSTLLGHTTLAGTEYYARLTQEMFPDLNIKVSEISSYVFPTLNNIIKIEQHECEQ